MAVTLPAVLGGSPPSSRPHTPRPETRLLDFDVLDELEVLADEASAAPSAVAPRGGKAPKAESATPPPAQPRQAVPALVQSTPVQPSPVPRSQRTPAPLPPAPAPPVSAAPVSPPPTLAPTPPSAAPGPPVLEQTSSMQTPAAPSPRAAEEPAPTVEATVAPAVFRWAVPTAREHAVPLSTVGLAAAAGPAPPPSRQALAAAAAAYVTSAAEYGSQARGAEAQPPSQEGGTVTKAEEDAADPQPSEPAPAAAAGPASLSSEPTPPPAVASAAGGGAPGGAAAGGQDEESAKHARSELLTLERPSRETQPPLDVPSSFLHVMLEPLRDKLARRIDVRLEDYDAAEVFPRCEDGRHGNRDGFETYIRTEAVKELRGAIAKQVKRSPRAGQIWKVVGGAGKGGIIVRSDLAFESPAVSRVSTGAWVQELELVGERLRYRLVKGSGPDTGWVSLRSGEKILLERLDNLPASVIRAMLTARRSQQPDQGIAEEWSQQPELPQQQEIAEESQATPEDKQSVPSRVIIFALMAAHIASEQRLERLRFALASIKAQELSFTEADLVVAVSWHSPLPQLAQAAREAMAEFTADCGMKKARIALEQSRRHTQFQHLWAALRAAEDELRQRWGSQRGDEIWVLFGDDDDLWHPERVAQYVRAIRAHPLLEGVGVFATMARAVVRSSRPEIADHMPTTAAEVDACMERQELRRMDTIEKCEAWRRTLRAAGENSPTLTVRQDLPLEYFDFCPRLRILHEFFSKATPALLAHRYCDLRLDEFLLTYSTCGREMGLEMSFFEPDPHCWMYFYANAGVSGLDLEASIDWWDERINFIGANDGHVSSRVEVEPCDSQHALAFWQEFRGYEDVGMTERKLAKYLAAFRNVMEISLARSFSRKVDQRIFDGFVCYGVKNSFGRFLYRIDSCRRDAARQKVSRCCQRFAAGLARNFQVRILWHDRERVFMPEDDSAVPFG